ncbi:MAG: hypothetical protein QM669_15370 [Siphonobacter sp.]
MDSTIHIRARELAGKSLDLSGYQHEKASISAGRRLKLNWKAYRDGIAVI